jgi:hypothetical protein
MPGEIWEAERIEGRQENGRTKPLHVAAVLVGPDEAVSERRVFLVKLHGLPEITEQGLFAEFFGTQLAGEFDIDVADTALVNVSSELLIAAAENLRRWGVAPLAGVGVGAELLQGLAPLSQVAPAKSDDELRQAARIYVFDMLVQNPDRRLNNPNCASRGRRFLAYDHEMAFSFLYPLVGRQPAPGEVDRRIASNHIFHGALSIALARGVDLGLADMMQNVLRLRAATQQLVDFVPERWNELAERVATHVAAVCGRLDSFETALRESLS